MVEVADAFKHPDYDVISNENDFAVVQLSQSVNYTDFVRPLCLATSQVETVTYYGCYIAGWGTTSYDGKNKDINQNTVRSEYSKMRPIFTYIIFH